MGYEAGVAAYRKAAAGLGVHDLTHHYTDGLRFFHGELVPHLAAVLAELTGGVWDLSGYKGYAAGSDVDFMTHLVSAVAARDQVALYPGDWFGFRVGVADPQRILWDAQGRGALACLCVPSVRNGHVTAGMLEFLSAAPALLLNLNLLPTLPPAERRQVAAALAPLLPRAVLSISFSRGFGLTGSQLGVALVHPEHPFNRAYGTQWNWLTYFYNGIAARAFMHLDIAQMQQVDTARRAWVGRWLTERGLPVTDSGSYYVKSFRVLGDAPLPQPLALLQREGVLRLCLKPPLN